MKIQDVIIEAQFNPKIKQILQGKGYKYLASGQDQDVFLAPDGTILKIFGYSSFKETQGFTHGQRSFIDFADYCRKNANNPLLPNILGWETFEFEGRKYLQIQVERLFPLKENFDVRDSLEILVLSVRRLGAKNGLKDWLEDASESSISQIILLLGEDNLKLLVKTIDDLKKIANRRNYMFDLHGDNFMLSSEGDIVINDPFFVGDSRF